MAHVSWSRFRDGNSGRGRRHRRHALGPGCIGCSGVRAAELMAVEPSVPKPYWIYCRAGLAVGSRMPLRQLPACARISRRRTLRLDSNTVFISRLNSTPCCISRRAGLTAVNQTRLQSPQACARIWRRWMRLRMCRWKHVFGQAL